MAVSVNVIGIRPLRSYVVNRTLVEGQRVEIAEC